MILDYNYDRIKAYVLTMNLDENDLPINPLDLVHENYNIELFYDDLEGEEGYTLFNSAKNKYRIYIDNSFYHGRCNFTIAHEIGHIVLGHFNCNNFISSVMHSELDKHANAFASALLMPEHILQKFEFLTEDYIARTFGVSKNALNIRRNYVNINII
jgi:Zn-dependent peptidase ImmA (M78 family)